MGKVIIISIIIGALLIGALAFMFMNKENTEVISPKLEMNEIVTIDKQPATLQDRQLQMQKINKAIEVNYADKDETTKRMIALCMAGNVGACSILNERGIF